MDTTELTTRKAQLEQRREQIVAQANLDIGFVNGQIALIDELLAAVAAVAAPETFPETFDAATVDALKAAEGAA